jgi:hypothetical protein
MRENNSRSELPFILLIASLLTGAGCNFAESQKHAITSGKDKIMELKIGWGQCDITPDRPVMLAGQFARRVATVVKDPVTATVLALESGDTRVLLISCDLVGIDEHLLSEIRDAIRTVLPEIPSQAVIVNATHTHTAPVFRDDTYEQPDDPTVITPREYRAFMSSRVAQAAAEAWGRRAPGAISRAFARAVVGHNRRASFLDGTGKMYAKLDVDNFDAIEGFEDHSLHVLCTWDMKKQLTGLVLNLPCPSQATENLSEVSADFWHETRVALRKELGKDLPVLAQCAPAGDQSPHVQMYKKLSYEMYERLGRTEREEIGRRICAAVLDVMPAAKTAIQANPPLTHVFETVPLPRRKVNEVELAHAKAMLEKLSNDPEYTDPAKYDPSRSQRFINRNRKVIDRYENFDKDPTLSMELHVLRLGDVAFCTNSFELYLDFGLRIGARSVAAQTFQIQLCCGTDGYLPSERAVRQAMHPADAGLALGSAHNYGASVGSNLVGPDGGQVLVNRTLELIAKLFPEQK